MSDYRTIIVVKSDGVVKLTLNRPHIFNAINRTMSEELVRALDGLAQDEEARVLVLTGAGRGFCSGSDFSRGADADREPREAGEGRPRSSGSGPLSRRLIGLDIPTIAMVNGPAVGGGFDYALACDIRIGSEKARFQMTALRRGGMTAGGSSWLLPRMVGLGHAAFLTFSADFLEAEEAYRIGVLQRLVPAAELETVTMELAHRIASLPPLAIREAKRLMYRGMSMDLDASLDYAGLMLRYLVTTDDHDEGVRAFREKRAAVYKGR